MIIKNNRWKHLLNTSIFTSFIIIFLMASCEIGLGAAIDTEAPVISIDYPPTNSTIMGTFLLAGS